MKATVEIKKSVIVDLMLALTYFLDQHDALLRQPSSYERGKKIAQLSSMLEMAKDSFRFNALHEDFRKPDRWRKKLGLSPPAFFIPNSREL